ncbi:PAS domain-containing sensor histidine kinase [Devosia sp. Root413D1]|uniref:PAS domain-containing sensor histidine kinase n=1 Tax=unclassified Devosia TaxID=196773 RepID=UPI0006FA4FB3|nr:MULTISPECIES: PAS domain-containing sensor histidine kinase [unclassified Devosia]KQU95180.1 PAS domain-containing sensor histidine kinase [Devosia sp. Root105]KQW77726.1 PAS domain-containing sensor histidine kinase [Devosia sp. Root413D1]
MPGPAAEDLEDLYENAPCGYLSLGRDGRIVKSNQTLSRWLGIAPDALVGKRLRDLLSTAGQIFYETHFAPLLRMQGYFDEVALDLIRADGTPLHVLANAAERRDSEGELLFTRVTVFRATERRRYERELVDATETAQAETRLSKGLLLAEHEAAELREQFIAVLGHDLRNPLAAIDGGTNLLMREPQSEKSQRVIGLIRGSVLRMSGLIDNVMDFARGRLGGGLQLNRSLKPLLPTLAQVVGELRTSYPEREIELHLDAAAEVEADHARLAQMFSNLLANAITHGAADQPVRVDAVLRAGELELSVANAGPPIPPEAMAQLFQPFYRSNPNSRVQGLGLGLYIASQIAQAHGGRIDVTSDATETRFTFRMPQA